jgi:hypothetical protein
MNSLISCTKAQPTLGEEVMAMDEVDVNVSGMSINTTSDLNGKDGRK